jgi:aromatic ring-opening dioxygenase LigB subunit
MKKPLPVRNQKRLEELTRRDQQTDQAILTSLKNIEALLTKLLEQQTAEISPTNLSVDEEINLVLQQGIDPVAYLKAKHSKRKREAQP